VERADFNAEPPSSAKAAKIFLPPARVDFGCYMLQGNVCRGFLRVLGDTRGATEGATRVLRCDAVGGNGVFSVQSSVFRKGLPPSSDFRPREARQVAGNLSFRRDRSSWVEIARFSSSLVLARIELSRAVSTRCAHEIDLSRPAGVVDGGRGRGGASPAL